MRSPVYCLRMSAPEQPPDFNTYLYGFMGPDGALVPDPSFRPGLPPPDYLLAWEVWQDGDGTLWRLRHREGRYESAPYVTPREWAPVDVDPQTSRWLVDLLRPHGRSWAQVAREAARLRTLLDRGACP